ncbi:HAAS signaling domain-containing protein [Streptomyces panacea]|uniref:HAAS signaling domain-containing protein n=1 Tax=Streptomyces panacea TaxID=3035064 RepID=UPI003F4A3F8C
MTSTGDRLVEEYLGRLDNASVFLSHERRAELRQEIVEHIDAGLEEADAVHADAVRAVLKRLGPPADIVASELGPRSTGSTGSTPVVALGSAPVREAGHDGGGRSPVEGAGGGGSAPVPPARPRKVSHILIGSVATAVVLGVLVLGTTVSSSDVDQQQRGPSITPSESDVPGSEVSDEPPEVSPDTSLTPSFTPSFTPSEQLSQQPSQDAGESSS